MPPKSRLHQLLDEYVDTVWRCLGCGFSGWAMSFIWHSGCPVCRCGVRHGSAARSTEQPCLYCGLGDGAHGGSCRLQPIYHPGAALGTRRPGPDQSLSEARQWLLHARYRGVKCPCCGQFARVYKRKLNYSMAYALVLIYEYFADHDDWLHVPSYLNGRGVVARGGDWAKMVHWGLIVGSGELRDDQSPRVGNYKITERGVAFVERAISVSEYVVVYNAHVIGRSEKEVYIDEALGDHFNYASLMGGTVARSPRPPHALPPLPPDSRPRQRSLLDLFEKEPE